MEPAPLLADIASFPDGGEAVFARAADGTRIRMARWRGGAAGTIFLLPGRTEYIEKYDHVIRRLHGLGYTVACLDWRGQGLSDRKVPYLGHVKRFGEFQQDVAALQAWMADAPRPRTILAHSMGGCITMRAVLDGADVDQAIFAAPMWGFNLSPFKRVIAPFATRFLEALGRGKTETPGGKSANYLDTLKPADNNLTTDPDRFTWMKGQMAEHPELALGPPSISWTVAALDEMDALMDSEAPHTRALIMIGTDERVVSTGAVLTQAERMPNAALLRVEGARHELLQERAALAEPVWQRIEAFLASASTG